MNITKEMIEEKASETQLYEDGYKGFVSGAEWVLSLIEPTEANTSIMQAEASASAQGATVGKERGAKGVSGGVYCGCDIPNRGNFCYRCSKLISDDRA